MVGAHPLAVGLLGQRLRQHRHLRAKRVRDLDAQVTEAAEPDDRDLRTRPRAPVTQWRIQRDAREKQRRGDVEADTCGDRGHEMLVDHDVGGIAPVGRATVAPDAVVGADEAFDAVLLEARLAALAGATRVDHHPDTDPVADGEPGNRGADVLDRPGDLVSRHEREVHLAPLLASGVDVGVAYAGKRDLDEHVIWSDFSSFDGGLLERHLGARRGVGGHLHLPICSSVVASSVTTVITGMAHVAICVPDIDAAVAWYESVLGLKVLSPPYLMTGDAIDEDMGELVPRPVAIKAAIIGVDYSDQVIEVVQYPNQPPHSTDPGALDVTRMGVSHVGLLCDDIDATRADLEGKGVEFVVSKVASIANLRTTWFRDPWGIVFILLEKSRSDKRTGGSGSPEWQDLRLLGARGAERVSPPQREDTPWVLARAFC